MLLDYLKNHYTLGAFIEEELVAFSILFYGMESDENLGRSLSIKDINLKEVANVKLIIVKKEYRGNNLQKIFIKKLEKVAYEQGFKVLAATISPLNIHSIKNFIDCGFIFDKKEIKYNNLERNIYYKLIK